jgi:hypothetical protein
MQISECTLATAFALGWLVCPAGKACRGSPLPSVLGVYTHAPGGVTMPVRPRLLRVILSLVYEVWVQTHHQHLANTIAGHRGWSFTDLTAALTSWQLAC